MTRMMMVPLDGTRFGAQALSWAVRLARNSDARLHIVHVRASLPLFPEPAVESYLANMTAQLDAQLPGRVTSSLLICEMRALEQAQPAPHRIAQVLLQHAVQHDVSAIVMTTHGRGGLRRAWLGSVASNVLRNSAQPVLLIRPGDLESGIAAEADRGISHVLIPLDGSMSALAVLPFAQQLGAPTAARYTLITVAAPQPWGLGSDMGAFSPVTYPVATFDRDTAQSHLNRAAERLSANGAHVTTRVLDAWPPDAAIVHYAAAHEVDVIAMATAAGDDFARLFVGSIADQVIRSSKVPVLCCNSAALSAASSAAVTELADGYMPMP